MLKMSISKQQTSSLVRSCSFSQYGKCGNIASKFISFLLVITTLFVFSFPVYAADGAGDFDTDDIFTTAYIITESSEYINVTNNVTVDNVSSGTFKGFKKYSVPILQNDVVKTQVQLTFEDKFTMRSDHEYNLKFQWGYRLGVPCTMEINLYIRDTSGTLIKTQKILTVDSPGNSKIQNVDCNFSPSLSNIESGYTCNFVIRLTQKYFESSTGSPQEFFVSPTVSLTDLDDNTGVLNGIIQAIKEIPEKIKGFFVDLGNTILDGIKNLFIPDEEYLANKKVELETFCVEHFGAVYQSIDVFIQFLTSLVNISPSEPKITFPAIDVPVMGKTYHLTDEIVYSFAWVNDGSHFLHYFYTFYRGFVTVLLFLSFINYCRNKYSEIFGGDKE